MDVSFKLVQTAHVKVLTTDGSCSSIVQRSHDSDQYSFSYVVCHCLKVVTETCHLFFLPATEESLELVPALCHFVAMLRHCTCIHHVATITMHTRMIIYTNVPTIDTPSPVDFLTTPFITLAWLIKDRSLCQLACRFDRPLVSLARYLANDQLL